MPLPADAPDLSGLIELSRDPQLDLKPVVLRVQTDLFLAAPIRDRSALEAFASLATGLIPTVDEETALIVARKLGPCADTPESVLIRLTGHGAPVAECLLASVVRPSEALLAAAREAGADIAAVPARTAAAEPSESCWSDEVEENGAEAPTDIASMVSSARKDAAGAQALLGDAALAPSDLAPLWLHAEPHQRNAIRDAIEATAGLRPCPPAPRDLAGKLVASSSERDVGGFVAALAAGLGLPGTFLGAAPDAVARYDLLTLALRAADLRESDAIHIFLTLNDTVARSVQRVFELVQLYRETSRAAARDLLCAILDVELPERTATGEHRPYLAPDGAKLRHAAATERAATRPAASTQRVRRIV